MTYELLEMHQCFGGEQRVYRHQSEATQSAMHFGLFLPPQSRDVNVPVLYWLSGLSCTEQNFITKSGAQRIAAQLGMALVVPDTSPRKIEAGVQLPDVGEGASFYVDAVQEPWCKNYQMYTYISQELPHLIRQYFPVDSARCGIFGHSMGGHGALMIGLRNPDVFSSISAFAPIASIMHAPWGINALTHYLGINQESWQLYDACYLLQTRIWPHGEILIDQGTADPFLQGQLQPHLLSHAVSGTKNELKIRMQQGYDHSYYFISTFIDEHLRFHVRKWAEKP